MLEQIVLAAHDKKAQGLVALDVSQLVYYTDYFLICSGRSDQHVKAITSHVVREMAEQGCDLVAREGEDHHRWVLMDFGDVIVHVFYEPLRNLYELEKLWADAPAEEFKPPGAAADQSLDDADQDDPFAEWS